MKTKLAILFFLTISTLVVAQKKYDGEKLEVIQILESKRKDFKAAKNDSIYISANSDDKYSIIKIIRGDQADDIETQIFGAKIGDVVGPFDGENTFYLLKIISMDSLKRTKAKLVSFYPRGEYTSDSLKFSNLVNKYIDAIKKGKEYGKMLVKEEASIGLRNKGYFSYWENQPTKENFDVVFGKTCADPYIKNVGKEIQVLYVVEENRNTPYEAKVLRLVKKLK